MDAITLSIVVGEDRRLIVQLPDNIPAGPVELTVRPIEKTTVLFPNGERERIRAKMLTAGILDSTIRAPENTVRLAPDELLGLGTLPPGSRPTADLINEDRGAL